MEALFGATTEQVRLMQVEMKERMEKEGLEYGARSMTYNSRLAQEIGAWADSLPGDAGTRIHSAFFRAYFVDARNLADHSVILDVTAACGLSTKDAREVITDRTFGDAVDEDWDRSRQLGVTGVPTFVMGNGRVVGAQPYEALDRFVRGAIGADD